MTPEEAKQRIQDGLPLTLQRKTIYKIVYTGFGGAIKYDDTIAWIETETLATKVHANLTEEVAKLRTQHFMELTNPDEADPKVPVYLPNLGSKDYLTAIETLEFLYSGILAKVTEDEAALLLTVAVPRLGLVNANNEVELPPP